MATKNKTLSDKELKVITETVIKINERQRKKSAKEVRDARFMNTELLMKNYRKLKALCSNIDEEVDEFESSILNLEELTLDTLMKYKFKTAKMMHHVDTMLKAYEDQCQHGTPEDHRRFNILCYRYINKESLSVKEICEVLKIEQATVYRDTKRALRDMTTNLFGIDAIDFVENKA